MTTAGKSKDPSPLSWAILIPARLESSRLPQKPLADLAGKPLIVRVYENLHPLTDDLGIQTLVLTDSEQVATVCHAASVPVLWRNAVHPSGSARCAAALDVLPPSVSHVLNVQGDEPFIAVSDLRRLMRAHAAGTTPLTTLVHPLAAAEAASPHRVKVVCSRDQRALYFSRALVPYHGYPAGDGPNHWWGHIGVYAFQREALTRFAGLPPSPLEISESLEQLRALEAGWAISVVIAERPSLGIDTAADLAQARACLGRLVP